MSEGQDYLLRWRGREMGPYSLDEINRQLDDHKIGMGHDILCEGQWTTLEQFFAAQQPPVAPAPPVSKPVATPTSSSSGVRLPKLPGTSRPDTIATAPPAADTGPAMAEAEALDIEEADGAKPRRRLVYALLGIFFGFTGLHNYYARHWLTGLLQMLLSIATFLLGFGIVASWFWAVVEAVLVRRDGNDLEMI